VERSVAEAAPAAQFLDQHPRIGLFEKVDDLLFFMSVMSHDLTGFLYFSLDW